MRNKSKLIIALFLSFLIIFSNISFVFAEDEVVNTEEPQMEQVEKTETEEVKIEETQTKEVEEIKEAEEIEEVEEVTIEREEQTPNPDGSVKVHYTNVLSSLSQHREDGKPGARPIPYEYDITLSKTQTKNQAHKGTYSYFGGADYSFGYMGVQYTFLNAVVETEKDKNNPVFNNVAPEDTTITKVKNSSGDITYTYKNGETELVKSRSDIYLSPVYKQEQSWKLNYNYIDNISTGTGSWSNLDAITQYKHTFSNPETKSPTLTDGLYQFKYWENEETGIQYNDGDEFIYKGEGLTNGETKNVNVYAYWQPVVKVNLYNGSELIQSLSSFESISSIDFTTIANTTTREFLGWSDENNELADIYYAPAITKEKGYLIINLFAKFKEIIQPTEEPTEEPIKEPTETPIEPTKPQPKNPQPQTQPAPQTEDIIIATTNPPTTTINPAPTPKAEPEGSWALINLIAIILACICALVLLFVRKDTENDEPTDEEKKDMRKILATKIASILVGIISVIAFILTEDMSLPMVLTDKWTFLMILLLIIEIVNIFIIRRQSKGEEDDDNN